MIKITEIQNAIAKKLKESTGYRVYKSDVIEAYKAPCFFIETILNSVDNASISTVRCELTVNIFYFAHLENQTRVRDEIDNETMIGNLYEMFGVNFPVKDRVFTTKNIGFSFSGEVGDIPKVSFDVTYFDSFDKQTPESEELDYIDEVKTSSSFNN